MSEPAGSNLPSSRPPAIHGFEQLVGDAASVTPSSAPSSGAAASEDASDTDLFPTLRAHRFEGGGREALRDQARAVADESQAAFTAAAPGRGRGGVRRRPPATAPELEAVPSLLKSLGVEPICFEEHPNRFTLEVPSSLAKGLPPVPEGYGFKGGVARKVLARMLGLNAFGAAVRDIDLLRTEETPDTEDEELAMRYMPDDLTLGEFGIEVLGDEEPYLGSRELTVNQLVLVGDELTVTHACLLDTLGLTLRVTGAHLTRTRGYVHPGVALKALRFAANLTKGGGEPRVLPFRVSPRRMKHGFDFYFALHLSRVFENGRDAADVYMRLASDRGFLRRARLPEDATAGQSARILKKRLAAYHLDFPDSV